MTLLAAAVEALRSGQDRRRQRHRRLSPRRRRHRRECGRRAAAAQSPRRQAVRRHGSRICKPPRRVVEARRREAAAPAHLVPPTDRARAPTAPAVSWLTSSRPGCPSSGVMLPYTPLHHLLLADVGRPLVMTSGNLSDEPIAHEDDGRGDTLGVARRRAALPRSVDSHPVRRLGGPGRGPPVAGPSSVARVRARAVAAAVRARGIESSRSVRSSSPRSSVTKGRRSSRAITSATSSISRPTRRSSRRSITASVVRRRPEVVAHDLHPEYLSSKYAAGPRSPDDRGAAPPRARRRVHGRARLEPSR